jgi:hypothetical protein
VRQPICYHGVPYPRVEDGNHDCREWLEAKFASAVEPHGEYHEETWFECVRCKSVWTERDLEMADAA